MKTVANRLQGEMGRFRGGAKLGRGWGWLLAGSNSKNGRRQRNLTSPGVSWRDNARQVILDRVGAQTGESEKPDNRWFSSKTIENKNNQEKT